MLTLQFFSISGFDLIVSFSVFSPNAGKYGPENTPYLDTFHAMNVLKLIRHF